VYLHVKELVRSQDRDLLVPGARVSFDVKEGPKGFRAARVTLGGETAMTEVELREELQHIISEHVGALKRAVVDLAVKNGWVR
jgi:hypothetical protein